MSGEFQTMQINHNTALQQKKSDGNTRLFCTNIVHCLITRTERFGQ